MSEAELLDHYVANIHISFEEAERMAKGIIKPGEVLSQQFIIRVMTVAKFHIASEMVRTRRTFLREGHLKCSRRRVSPVRNSEER